MACPGSLRVVCALHGELLTCPGWSPEQGRRRSGRRSGGSAACRAAGTGRRRSTVLIRPISLALHPVQPFSEPKQRLDHRVAAEEAVVHHVGGSAGARDSVHIVAGEVAGDADQGRGRSTARGGGVTPNRSRTRCRNSARWSIRYARNRQPARGSRGCASGPRSSEVAAAAAGRPPWRQSASQGRPTSAPPCGVRINSHRRRGRLRNERLGLRRSSTSRALPWESGCLYSKARR
jgi:hypothetical protein